MRLQVFVYEYELLNKFEQVNSRVNFPRTQRIRMVPIATQAAGRGKGKIDGTMARVQRLAEVKRGRMFPRNKQ